MSLFSTERNSTSPNELPATSKGGRWLTSKRCIQVIGAGVVAVVVVGMISICPCMTGFKAARLDAGNNSRQIAIAYSIYLQSDAHRAHPELASRPTSVSEFAVFLTVANPEINSAKLWFILNDDRLDDVEVPIHVVSVAASKPPVPPKDFITAGPKSWAVVVNIPTGMKPDSYPIAWTRGLRGTGWSEGSPWKGKGGHVAFLSGSVMWVDSTIDEKTGEGVFVDFITGKPTSDIRAAIGPGARVLEDE